MDTFSFEKLEAYKQARNLVIDVYKIIDSLPNYERFALSLQLQRSIVSVKSNIAEGSGRYSMKEKIHFIEIAFGSLMEAYSQLETCLDLNYINEEDLVSIKHKFLIVSRLLNGLKQSFIKKMQIPQNTTQSL